MGSGKSTVGRQLALEQGWPYVDNDVVIAELAGRSTVELSQAGGTLLHDWEARYAEHLVGRPAPFIAGIPASAAERADELRALRRTGVLVYLRCDPATLTARVARDAPRPWLTRDVGQLIVAMFGRRDAVLRAACDHVVDATRPVATVVSEIIASTRAIPTALEG
jgi:shikimate kinase